MGGARRRTANVRIAVHSAGLACLLAGAICYTGGIASFLVDSRLKFAHSIWHLFVLAGSACHFVAIVWYA
ncbi:hypothetical protein LJ655_09085 [Paraburkholderia sp. MMS20-SJTN17]|uniref:Hemolysin III n=1 Tax=Paraburkholderia translucens TaxID=2886945 RepID=A0ABS8KC49_9BURK|nr:hypothetical protein [Paraburkholderia sp. MMS20-SJTN17]MCC8402044.1 hypothetical protein [Paraburkholderia sp. MMS20-SJTN17]